MTSLRILERLPKRQDCRERFSMDDCHKNDWVRNVDAGGDETKNHATMQTECRY